MREILFRGKRIDNNEWTYGDLIQDGNGYVGMWAQTPSAVNYEVDPETIGQYTGLKDVHGMKIFEGDILKNALDNSISVVEWSEAHTGFTLKTRGTIYGFPKIGHEVYKIIGNIFDNPELLEDEKNV